MMKVPCEGCITLSICMNKTLGQLLKCSIFKRFITDTNINGVGFRVRYRGKLVRVLKPKSWTVNSKGLLQTSTSGLLGEK